MDARGNLDLILLFDAPDAAVMVFRGTGNDGDAFAGSGEPLILDIDPALGRPLDVTTVAGRNAPNLDLALLTTTGVYTTGLNEGANGLRAPAMIVPQVLPESGGHRITGAQVDGDGLQDLLFGTDSQLFIYTAREDFVGTIPEDL